jgi:transcriptional regulator with XRE-family HTH domain
VSTPYGADEQAFLHALGRHIKLLRVGADLTQEQLADRAGLSRQFMGMLERGERSVDVLRLRRLAAALDVDLGTLLDLRTR